MTSTAPLSFDLPDGWAVGVPESSAADELTDLLRRHEAAARGWAGTTTDVVVVALCAANRGNLMVRDDAGAVRGWATSHDRASGRMLLTVVVDPDLDEEHANQTATALFDWGATEAVRIGSARGLEVQQIDSGAFADDPRQHRWLERAGFTQVRTWWQMSRPVDADSPLEGTTRPGVRIRQVERSAGGMPEEHDLRTIHDVLESAFADHFNSHTETFDEFLQRLREDPGHRWDHWWIAELVEGDQPEPAGALVGSVSEGEGDRPDGSYVEYLGVLGNARGRGVAKSLLATVLADARQRGRDRVGLEVDADSPTGADRLYVSMGWQTKYVTESWHRDVPVRPDEGSAARTA